jgi:uncharacterized repeat protein (TIGR01451 family)
MRVCVRFCVFVLSLFAAIGGARANDNWPGTLITGTSGSVTGSTTGATAQANENTTYGTNTLNTIWYRWVAPSNGVFTASTCNLGTETTSNHDTTLIAYTGAALPLTVQSTNDDATGCPVTTGGGLGSVVTFNVTSGTTYYLQVDGYAALTGNFIMRYGMVGVNIAVTDNSATEGGGTGAFTVVLNSPPAAAPPGGNNMAAQSATVTIGTSTQCTFAPTPLTFTSTNWNVPQTVTVTAIDDAAIEGAHTCTPASITAATGAYAGVAVASGSLPVVNITDNENPQFSIVKSQSGGPNPITAAAQTITYSISVANTGNVALTAPVITDALLLGASSRTLTSGPTLTSGDAAPLGTLNVGETWIYTATYTVPQSDLNGTGNYSNTATFDTAETAASTSAAVTTNVTRAPQLGILKSWAFNTPSGDLNSNGIVDVGDTIRYSYLVSNTGNVTINTVSVNDVHLGAGSLSAISPVSVPSLAPGTNTTFTSTYVVTQTDIDNQ